MNGYEYKLRKQQLELINKLTDNSRLYQRELISQVLDITIQIDNLNVNDSSTRPISDVNLIEVNVAFSRNLTASEVQIFANAGIKLSESTERAGYYVASIQLADSIRIFDRPKTPRKTKRIVAVMFADDSGVGCVIFCRKDAQGNLSFRGHAAHAFWPDYNERLNELYQYLENRWDKLYVYPATLFFKS